MTEITHKQLCTKTATWLQNKNFAYRIVITELKTFAGEIPDNIGFNGSGGSILIECKISLADFNKDKEKHFRKYEEMGMGDERYFCAPKGILKPEIIPEKWGLIEYENNRFYTTKESEHFGADKRKELIMVVSAMRRLEIATCVFVRQDNPHTDGIIDE